MEQSVYRMNKQRTNWKRTQINLSHLNITLPTYFTDMILHFKYNVIKYYVVRKIVQNLANELRFNSECVFTAVYSSCRGRDKIWYGKVSRYQAIVCDWNFVLQNGAIFNEKRPNVCMWHTWLNYFKWEFCSVLLRSKTGTKPVLTGFLFSNHDN